MESLSRRDNLTHVVEWGFAESPCPGETVSGDLAAVVPLPNGVILAVTDALGHGPEAAVAARTAIAALEAQATGSVVPLFQHCHEVLVRTRGVVMTVVSLDVRASTLTWAGVGNVLGVFLRANPRGAPRREIAPTRGGVVGYALPRIHSDTLSISRGDLIALASDGIHDRFDEELSVSESVQRMADSILARHRRADDDALVLVARYLGGSA